MAVNRMFTIDTCPVYVRFFKVKVKVKNPVTGPVVAQRGGG